MTISEAVARALKAPQGLSALLLLGVGLGGNAACSSAGPYGFARTYSPVSGEEAAAEGAREYDPIMAGRRFHDWVGEKVSIFGVVKHREDISPETADLVLSVRNLRSRNLCETRDETSCRVTVTDHEFATIHASVHLAPEDATGKYRVNQGSLVRVIGKISTKTHRRTGNAVVATDYYRHWPRDFFVTTRARKFMKQ